MLTAAADDPSWLNADPPIDDASALAAEPPNAFPPPITADDDDNDDPPAIVVPLLLLQTLLQCPQHCPLSQSPGYSSLMHWQH